MCLDEHDSSEDKKKLNFFSHCYFYLFFRFKILFHLSLYNTFFLIPPSPPQTHFFFSSFIKQMDATLRHVSGSDNELQLPALTKTFLT